MPPTPVLTPRSAVAGLRWPGLPGGRGASLLALQYQLEQSQWWPPEALRAHQFEQLRALLDHALRNVPFYRQRLAEAGVAPKAPLTPEVWARIPLLTREDIQQGGDALLGERLPKSHGRTSVTTTSGSTGKPVTVTKPALVQLFWNAITLRGHFWHRRDLTKTLAVIRNLPAGMASYPQGARLPDWGPGSGSVFATGAAVMLSAASGTDEQVLWLQREDPEYLLTLPTSLLELLRYCGARGLRFRNLRHIETLGGVLHAEVRALCREVLGVPVVDTYSAQEVGYMALQCPDHEHFHVQAESALVEILDDAGQPCGPGQWGRVVVTPLHNFAMPLIRYDIGDRAEVGPPCACGRGLAVLRRILGRARNMLTLPTGKRVMPGFINDWFEGFPVSQFQIVQLARDHLETRIVPLRPFTEAEEERVRALLIARLGCPFRITISYHDEIPRSSGGKYEDFRSELDV